MEQRGVKKQKERKRSSENEKNEKNGGGRNEINRGPSKNKTHKTKRRNKVSRKWKLHVINKQKQKK
ncbi:hypothetical protein RhiirB3_222668 [Rhizophagus irregularis]|nr:hypothetical protein RhiirB3_222668 [Rhizophagus irregularis]